MLYSIDTGYAYFGIVEENGVAIEAAPIAKWCVGKNIDYVLKYFRENKKANIIKIEDNKNAISEYSNRCKQFLF
jgi:hypothetical protein